MIANPALTGRAPYRVLVVEDESKLRESLMEGLRMEQWTVTGACNGAEARQQMAEQQFDLIVLDWMLPDYNGLEIVRELRAEGSNVPVLMITARDGATARDLSLQAGATDFLPKPFSFDDLLAHSRALLR
jgi:two-component system, OmpR family, response regulator